MERFKESSFFFHGNITEGIGRSSSDKGHVKFLDRLIVEVFAAVDGDDFDQIFCGCGV